MNTMTIRKIGLYENAEARHGRAVPGFAISQECFMPHAVRKLAGYFSLRSLTTLLLTTLVTLLIGCNSGDSTNSPTPNNPSSINPTSGDINLSVGENAFFALTSEQETVYTHQVSLLKDPNTSLMMTKDGYSLVGSNDTHTYSNEPTQPLNYYRFPVAPEATTLVSLQLNLDATAPAPINSTFSAINPGSYNWSTNIDVYDTLGEAHPLRAYFIKSATNFIWQVYFVINGVSVGAAHTLIFDSNGSMVTPSSGQLQLQPYPPSNGAVALSVTMDLSRSTQISQPFQISSDFQNGASTESADLTAILSNGRTWFTTSPSLRTFEGNRVMLAKFGNPTGLMIDQNGRYHTTSLSGDPVLGLPGENGLPLILVE
jgi:flagellar hook protein FlgE